MLWSISGEKAVEVQEYIGHRGPCGSFDGIDAGGQGAQGLSREFCRVVAHLAVVKEFLFEQAAQRLLR